jgi:hypothetical protein
MSKISQIDSISQKGVLVRVFTSSRQQNRQRKDSKAQEQIGWQNRISPTSEHHTFFPPFPLQAINQGVCSYQFVCLESLNTWEKKWARREERRLGPFLYNSGEQWPVTGYGRGGAWATRLSPESQGLVASVREQPGRKKESWWDAHQRRSGAIWAREKEGETEVEGKAERLSSERQRERGERKEKTGRWEALKGRERVRGFRERVEGKREEREWVSFNEGERWQYGFSVAAVLWSLVWQIGFLLNLDY